MLMLKKLIRRGAVLAVILAAGSIVLAHSEGGGHTKSGASPLAVSVKPSANTVPTAAPSRAASLMKVFASQATSSGSDAVAGVNVSPTAVNSDEVAKLKQYAQSTTGESMTTVKLARADASGHVYLAAGDLNLCFVATHNDLAGAGCTTLDAVSDPSTPPMSVTQLSGGRTLVAGVLLDDVSKVRLAGTSGTVNVAVSNNAFSVIVDGQAQALTFTDSTGKVETVALS